MPIPMYLAMTAAEIATCTRLSPEIGWMACHFSPSGPGLSNVPKELPPHSLLILDDSTPFSDQQPTIILAQLQEVLPKLKYDALILDFQRKSHPDIQKLTYLLQRELPCPVAAPPDYGISSGPVFLSACPPNRSLQDHISPFRGRKVFLEVALDGLKLSVTDKGCLREPLLFDKIEEFPHKDEKLHCHYRIVQRSDTVEFTLQRTHDDLTKLLQEADSLGVSLAVGLWQEIKKPPVG